MQNTTTNINKKVKQNNEETKLSIMQNPRLYFSLSDNEKTIETAIIAYREAKKNNIFSQEEICKVCYDVKKIMIEKNMTELFNKDNFKVLNLTDEKCDTIDKQNNGYFDPKTSDKLLIKKILSFGGDLTSKTLDTKAKELLEIVKKYNVSNIYLEQHLDFKNYIEKYAKEIQVNCIYKEELKNEKNITKNYSRVFNR